MYKFADKLQKIFYRLLNSGYSFFPCITAYDYLFDGNHFTNLLSIQEYDTQLLKTGDVSKYVQQSIRAGTEEWEQLVSSTYFKNTATHHMYEV